MTKKGCVPLGTHPFRNSGSASKRGAIRRLSPEPTPLSVRVDYGRSTSAIPTSRHRDRSASPPPDCPWRDAAGRYNRRMSVVIVYCTCPDADSAAGLARDLVEERLAACVTRVPGTRSCYRWQGRVEEATEELLMIKTTPDRLEALQRRVQELHP